MNTPRAKAEGRKEDWEGVRGGGQKTDSVAHLPPPAFLDRAKLP